MEQTYSIYALGCPDEKPQPLKRAIRRAIYGYDVMHCFLALARETPDADPEIVSELRFSGKNGKGDWVLAAKSPLTWFAIAADRFNLAAPFRRAVEGLGFGDHLAHLKGVHKTKDLAKFDNVASFGGVTGPEILIRQEWNRACEAATEINLADLTFLNIGHPDRGPVNCVSGPKAILRALGGKFSPILDAMRDVPARRLEDEIPTLRNWPSAEQVAGISKQSLLDANDVLSERLYETSRTVTKAVQTQPQTAGLTILTLSH